MSGPAVTRHGSLAADLEQRRLELRARKLEHALAALRERAEAHRARGDVPVPLRHAITGFADELRTVRRRLGDAPRVARFAR